MKQGPLENDDRRHPLAQIRMGNPDDRRFLKRGRETGSISISISLGYTLKPAGDDRSLPRRNRQIPLPVKTIQDHP